MNHREPPTVTLRCDHPGCTFTTRVMLRHVENLTASGGWTCHRHRDDGSSGVMAEVPC